MSQEPIVIDGIAIEQITPTPCFRISAHGIGIEPFCTCPQCEDRGPESRENARKAREVILRLIYRHMSKDYKGRLPDGTKSVLIFRNGTTLVPLDQLTDREIADLAPSAQRKEQRRLADKQAKETR